jgi:periplasmic protein CpxP/Spy
MRRCMAILTAFCLSAECRFSEDFLRFVEHFEKNSRLKEQTWMPEISSGRRRSRGEMPMKMTLFRKAGVQGAVLALCTATLYVAPMMAQDAAPAAPPAGQMRGGPGHRGDMVEMLTKKLNLTPDQVTQVKAINADAMTQAKAVHDDSSLSQADMRSKMMDIHKTSQDKIRGILTDEQKTKYDAMQAEMKAKMQERRQGGGDAPQPAPPQ